MSQVRDTFPEKSIENASEPQQHKAQQNCHRSAADVQARIRLVGGLHPQIAKQTVHAARTNPVDALRQE